MALTITKGYITGDVFTATTATWFFESPYWNNDGTQDFAIQITNSGDDVEHLGGLDFSFLVAKSNVAFTSASGSEHTASGNGCTMYCTIEYRGETYTASREIPASTTSNIQYSAEWGQSYFEPRPGTSYRFTLNQILDIPAGVTVYVKFKAVFNTDMSGENCIQISQQDTVTVTPVYKIEFDPNGGKITSGNQVQYIAEGSDAIPPEVELASYKFTGWSPSSGWTNVTSDMRFSAQWALAAFIWRYNKSKGQWEKVLIPKKYNKSTNTWSDLTVHNL